MNFHFTLQPYKGPASRYTCPQCNVKRCFTRYINTTTGEHLNERVGKCDRLNNCGYHFKPKQYFAEHGNVSFNDLAVKPPVVLRRTSYIPYEEMRHSWYVPVPNHFIAYLSEALGKITGMLMEAYRFGTSEHWPGATVFWQIDKQWKIRTGKIMLYDKHTGKRVKQPYNHVTWAHRLKDNDGRLRYPNFQLRQCFFGEHLLEQYPDKDVAIVESEKTAVIASARCPEMIWLAAGSLEGLTAEKCRVLHNRRVILYPDKGAYHVWNARRKLLLPNSRISGMLEKDVRMPDGGDVADR